MPSKKTIKTMKKSKSFTPLNSRKANSTGFTPLNSRKANSTGFTSLNSRKANSTGFTLIELLVVVAIIGIIATIAVVATRGVIGRARIARTLQSEASIHRYLGMDIVGWWKFNDETDRYKDISGKGNHGSCTSCPTAVSGVPGKGGSAMSFNGSTDNVRISDDPTLRITDAITVMAWVKGEAQSGSSFFTKHDRGLKTLGWEIVTGRSEYSDKLRILLSKDGTLASASIKRYKSSIVAVDNTWHHVAFTFTNNTLKLYVDGAEDPNPTKDIDSPITTLHESTADVMIGSRLNNNSPEAFFNGQIDDARIYAEVLTSEEINTLYAETKHKYLAENNNKEK